MNFFNAFAELDKLYEQSGNSSLTEGVKENIAEFLTFMQKNPQSMTKNKVKKAGECAACGGELEATGKNEMHKCTYCGNEYYQGKQRLFCIKCGGDIEPDKDCKCKSCGTTLTGLKAERCSACGGQVKNGKCSSCGNVKA
jgi:DNA-directed RNA polymerase subunit RPC12/RpoP